MAPAARSAWRRPRLQRLALRVCGLAPLALHRALARASHERRGRRLEPDVERLVRMLDRFGWPDFADLSPSAARKEIEREAWIFRVPRTRDVAVTSLDLPGRAGPLAARLYVPSRTATADTLLLYLHGGGWVFGSPATHDGLCRLLARSGRLQVLSTSYRLAPEHPFPAAVDDAMAALEWTLANARELGAARVGVGGDSAGGNLAMVLARQASDRIAFQLLLCPIADLSREHPSYATSADGPVLTARQMRWFRTHYLSDPDDALDPRASPLVASSLDGLPPTYLALAGFDPLHDEGLAYATRLKSAGVDLTLADHDALPHALAELTAACPSARAALLHGCRWLAAR
jgi:acetyl esterase